MNDNHQATQMPDHEQSTDMQVGTLGTPEGQSRMPPSAG